MKHKLLKHDWPPHPSLPYQGFSPDSDLDWVIKVMIKRTRKKPAFILLPNQRWWVDSGAKDHGSYYYLHDGVKITWHPENRLLLKAGPVKEKR